MTAPPLLETDPFDARLARNATGTLRLFNEAGVLSAADIHVATTVARLARETNESVVLAAALAVRALRNGSVCVDLGTVASLHPDLPWPAADGWTDRVAASALAGDGRPLRVDLGLLYLDRYWRQEVQVCADLLARAEAPAPVIDEDRLGAGLDRLFPGVPDAPGGGRQRRAAEQAARCWTVVIGGGPGTGKTTTVSKILALLADQPAERLRIAMAAPTGKAAARLQEAVQQSSAALGAADRERIGELSASTLHRLLGARFNSSRFVFDRDNRLPYDVVVVDEASMVSLTLMARLLEAVRPQTRLILVGDPDQLAPVEAGAVLADVVAGLTAGSAASDVPPSAPPVDGGWRERLPVVILDRRYRFFGAIARLAAAVRDGDGDAALGVLGSADPAVELTADALSAEVREDVVETALAVRAAALFGDASAALDGLDRHRLLCAHRTGPYGVEQWGRLVDRWIGEARGHGPQGDWYPGRPVLVTSNDDVIGLYNGDVGVAVAAPAGTPWAGQLRVVFRRGSGVMPFATSRVPEVQTLHAMTVHRSQGSQFDRVTLILPEPGSPLLTRELLYTAITRAQRFVRIVGTEEALREAVARPALRASGLRERLAR